MIAIIDYGLGNLHAFSNIYRRLDIRHKLVKDPADLEYATHIILPGVGSFDYAMKLLELKGFDEALDKQVLSEAKPILGVCVGMQVMAQASEEGIRSGFGWFDEKVQHFGNRDSNLYTPHMGWNEVGHSGDCALLDGIESGSEFYFLHSYFFPESRHSVGLSEYHTKFSSIMVRDNIFGIQCHPEKSHSSGYKLLENFARV